MLYTDENVDKKFQLSILNSSQENQISPISLWTDGGTDIVNYRVTSQLKKGIKQESVCPYMALKTYMATI